MNAHKEHKRDTDPADTKRVGRASRPKLSATLILLRGDVNTPQVLMGKRAAGHGFMPSKMVFPGGRAERSDAFAPAASALPATTKTILHKHLSPGRAHAAASAAIRETFEETGLFLANSLTVPPGKPAPKGWQDFRERSLGADLGALEVVARAITPPYHPKRFDTWFFAARADNLIDLPQYQASGELEALEWFTLAQTKTLDLPAITSIVLDDVAKRLRDAARPAPFYHARFGKHLREHL